MQIVDEDLYYVLKRKIMGGTICNLSVSQRCDLVTTLWHLFNFLKHREYSNHFELIKSIIDWHS